MLKSIHTLLFYSKFLQLAGRKRNGSSAIGTNAASVCLSSGFLKNVQTDFHETFHGSKGSYVDVNGKHPENFDP